MATTNRQRVDEALMLVRDALVPFFQQVIIAKYGGAAWERALKDSDRFGHSENVDLTRLRSVFHEHRNEVFKPVLADKGVNFLNEVFALRNDHSHQAPINTNDTLRALDTIQRLLELVQAGEAIEEVRKSHEQVLRSLYQERTRSETRRVVNAISVQGSEALTPWRQVAIPHEDVRSGNLKEAEFAADLDQVYNERAGIEYQDPVEFFRRTYLTEGLTNLLTTALKRLTDQGGDPVLELQTNFGGGKTHSMIALLHLVNGAKLDSLPGLDPIVQETGLTGSFYAQKAVLVGTKLSPSEPRIKPDGTVVRTLWGELAWQLGKAQGFAFVSESDRAGTSPGADVLRELFDYAGPSLILIDEWVAFVRNLYFTSNTNPAAGTFDANLTFAQSLTEAVISTPGVLLAASLPQSEIEAGGDGGRRALEALRHTFSRVKAPWRPASTTEGFEIVRRRLFQEATDPRKRDGTIDLFVRQYSEGGSSFPASVKQPDYKRRMESAYPFHPETFDQLFETWATLENFQRTRGVLRLMANVVHALWDRNDTSPMIMPGNLPLDDVAVATEMGGYLPDSWTSVLETDIDGSDALSLELDRTNGNYGQYSATRRVARAIFLGTAPTFRAENRGISDQTIRLGVAVPGEPIAVFGDALRSYASRATYLYSEHGNYWFSTQPSVTMLAQQRIEQLPVDDIDHEIDEILRPHQSRRGAFDRVVVNPVNSGDVADTTEVTMVVLGPGDPHSRNQPTATPGIEAATRILDTRGDGRRVYRNAVLFLAPDRAKLDDVRKAVAQRIVWREIERTSESLNLDAYQLRQAKSQAQDAGRRVEALIRDTWTWLLVPHAEPAPGSPIEWDFRLLKSIAESESLPEAAAKRAISEEDMISVFAGSNIRNEIQRIPQFAQSWSHIAAKDLANWFPSYLYLPRLKNTRVVEEAIRQGLRSINWQIDSFAWADSWDEASGRYVGLSTSIQHEAPVSLTGTGMLVHPDVAIRQFDVDIEAERKRAREAATESGNDDGEAGEDRTGEGMEEGGVIMPPLPPGSDPTISTNPQRYFGSVTLNPQTLASQVREISNAVISQLQTIYGAEITVTLEIQAKVPDGIPEERKRLVQENSASLKFDQSDFTER